MKYSGVLIARKPFNRALFLEFTRLQCRTKPLAHWPYIALQPNCDQSYLLFFVLEKGPTEILVMSNQTIPFSCCNKRQ